MSEKREKAREIAESIASDIKGRRGIGNEWEMIDDVIQEEIIDAWMAIIEKEL